MPVITEISVQKKNAGRVNLYLDGRFFCGMQLDTVAKHSLKVGSAVDIQKLAEIQFESEKDSCLQRGLKYVSGAAKTHRQLEDYLKDKGYVLEVVSFAAETLSQYGYLDDLNYARMYLTGQSAVKGKKLLKFELMHRGIAADVAEEALSDIEDEADSCRAAAEKYLRGKSRDAKLKAKLGNYLFGRGYSSDTIRAVSAEILAEED